MQVGPMYPGYLAAHIRQYRRALEAGDDVAVVVSSLGMLGELGDLLRHQLKAGPQWDSSEFWVDALTDARINCVGGEMVVDADVVCSKLADDSEWWLEPFLARLDGAGREPLQWVVFFGSAVRLRRALPLSARGALASVGSWQPDRSSWEVDQWMWVTRNGA